MSPVEHTPISLVVADDSDIVRNVVRRLVERDGRLEIVGEAVDGKSAIEMTSQLRPDILLLDLRLPDMDGLSVAARLLGEATASRIVLFSGGVDGAIDARARAIGIRGIIEKHEPPMALVTSLLAAAGYEFS